MLVKMQSRTVKPGYQEVLGRQNHLYTSKSPTYFQNHLIVLILAMYLPHDSSLSQQKLTLSLDDCLAVATDQW